ncbi:carboxylesterase/lipase family protein [Paraburkholderia heleia]|uniref:carboxylesterase/lipase family protein n=1 Tax=Paraburkholderia heleia TaxID=634127 RepID=UPI0005A6C05C|nr:carboxylesterase/lipase family protein [Paraburkholderia heleia]
MFKTARQIIARLGGLAAGLAVVFGLITAMPVHAQTGPIVTTKSGAVQGAAKGAYDQFLAIPYAAPPIGPLRFRPPQPASAWSGVRDATQPSSECIQQPRNNLWKVSEDCLYLNVYAPLHARNLPVMVEIYGGGWIIGGANDYDGGVISTRGNVVVVTLNYRLGALGWLTLPQLGKEDSRGASGNYGFLDQQAALRWVKGNIRAFGGNPDNVTIMGESAGGQSVCMHMVAPGSRGLFQKAISQSGFCALEIPGPKMAMEWGKEFAAALGCNDGPTAVECLRARKPEDFASGNALRFLGRFLPAWDGAVLPTDMVKSFKDGDYAHVPLIMGGNRDEGSILAVLRHGLALTSMSDADYAGILNRKFGEAGPDILTHYPPHDYATPGQALSAVITDGQRVCATQKATRLIAMHSPVYAYEYAYVGPQSRSPLPPVAGFDYGAAHSAEVGLVFGHGEVGDQAGPPLTEVEQRISDRLIAYWTHFAATGHPGDAKADGQLLPAWPTYQTAHDDVMLFTADAAMNSTAWSRHQCEFWDASGILDKTPVY